MPLVPLDPQPFINLKLVDAQNVPMNYWQGYLTSLDAYVRGLGGGNVGPLKAAANDTAAAAAGVQIGGLYQSSGAVRIRIV